MIIDNLNKLQTTVSIMLLLFMTTIYADISAENARTNGKVDSNTLSVQTAQPELKANNKSAIKANGWVLHAEQWEMARSGESILTLPVLNKLVTAWLRENQKKIEIQYPGGEEGEFWVQELTDWLVSLGIPSGSMIIVPGSGADDMIKFNLIK